MSKPTPSSADARAPAHAEGTEQEGRNILRIGELLSDTFEIRSLLGEGGMGQVYEAHDLVLNRRVAIKIPWRHVPTTVRTEARALAALRHPSMVAIHGVWKHDGLEYAVMERIYGESLETHLEQRNAAKNPFTVGEVLEILAGVAEGLSEVHRAGIAHRDVKPANIMVAPGNRLVLMDFGIFQPEIDYTKPKDVSGSPWYMAPEAIANAVQPGHLHLLDIYSFGILAFELLTGNVPFPGDSVMKVVQDQLHTLAPDLAPLRPDAPARLCALVAELLAKAPHDRPQAMDDVARQLRRMRRTTDPPPARLSVVIAEDDPNSAITLQALVLHHAPGADVRLAVDGQQALELVRRMAPHLLLIDLNMPKLSGVEVCMYLRGTRGAEKCTIVSMSAHAEDEDLALLEHLGIASYIPKGEQLAEQLPSVIADVKKRLSKRS